MPKNRGLSAPSLTPGEREIIEMLKKAFKRIETVPGHLKQITVSVADLQQRVSALEQQQTSKSPKRTR